MSTKFSREELKKSFQGREVPRRLREKVGEHFGDSFDSGEFRKKMYYELAHKSKYGRKEMYRKMGLNHIQQKKMESYMPKEEAKSVGSTTKKTGSFFSSVFGNKKHHQQEEHVLTDKQKRRNIFESRRSSEEAGDGKGSVAGTAYQQSSIGFGGGDVNVSHRVSSLKTAQEISGKGFAKKVDSPHNRGRSNTGFAKDISEGLEGKDFSGGSGGTGRPIGF